MFSMRTRRRILFPGGIFMQQGFTRDERGLTLMELIIVLAVIAIIGAIIAPNFLTATDKARLKSDVESARIIQAAIETYNAEQSEPIAVGGNVETVIIPKLVSKGYLSAADSAIPQTDLAVWVYVGSGIVKVNISRCSEKIRNEVLNTLSDKEQDIVSLIGAEIGG